MAFPDYGDYTNIVRDWVSVLRGDDVSGNMDTDEMFGFPGAEEEDYDTLLRKIVYQLEVAESQGKRPGDILMTPDGPAVTEEVIEDFIDKNPNVVFLARGDISGQIDDAVSIHRSLEPDVNQTYEQLTDVLEDMGMLDQVSNAWDWVVDQVGDGIESMSPSALREEWNELPQNLTRTASDDWDWVVDQVRGGGTDEKDDDGFALSSPNNNYQNWRRGFITRGVKGALGEIGNWISAAAQAETEARQLESQGTQALLEGVGGAVGSGIEDILSEYGEAQTQSAAARAGAGQAGLEAVAFPFKEGEFDWNPLYDTRLDAYLAGDVNATEVVNDVSKHIRDKGLTPVDLRNWLLLSPNWSPRTEDIRQAVREYIDTYTEEEDDVPPVEVPTDPMDTDALFIDQLAPALPEAYADLDPAGVVSLPGVPPRVQTGTPEDLTWRTDPRGTPEDLKWRTGTSEIDIGLAKTEPEDTPEPLGYREDLRAVYYNIMYAHPGAGRSDIQPYLEPLRRQSISLFFLHNGLTAWDLINNRIGDQPLTPEEAKRTLEVTYRDFLNGFLSNPTEYRAGRVFQDKLNTVTRILGRLENEPDQIKLPTDEDYEDSIWVEGIFGGEGGKYNRLDLIKLHITGGGQGYYSQRIHKVLEDHIQYYKNIGKTPGEIFATMMGTKGEGARVRSIAEAPQIAQAPAALEDVQADLGPEWMGAPQQVGQQSDPEKILAAQVPPRRVAALMPDIAFGDPRVTPVPMPDFRVGQDHRITPFGDSTPTPVPMPVPDLNFGDSTLTPVPMPNLPFGGPPLTPEQIERIKALQLGIRV